MVDAGKAGVANPGEHGFSEILYAFSSAGNNNGSAFAGLSANTPFYNTALGIAMLFARYWLAIPVLALAGAFAAAKRVPPSAGTLPTHTPLFVVVLIGTVITVGALTFVPALALGPVVEHLLLFAGQLTRAQHSKESIMATASRQADARCPGSSSRGPDEDGAHRQLPPADAALPVAQSGDVRRLHRQHPDDDPVDPGARRQGRGAGRFHPRRHAVAVGDAAVRQLRRGDRRGPQQGAGRVAQERAQGHDREEARASRSATRRRRRRRRASLRKGDIVLVEQGDLVPGDGEVIEGAASIDESAITGESAPVIRAAGSDFNTVTGGTRVLSDWIIVRINVNPGEAFLDRMIGMVEGAKRQKTPNEIALTILLVAMTLVFLLATVTLLPYSLYSVEVAKAGTPVTITVLVALLVCLIPTTIGGLLSAIGVAGMGRMMRANVDRDIRPRRRGRGRLRRAAARQDRHDHATATARRRRSIPVAGVTAQQLAEATLLASLGDETPEGKSIVVLRQARVRHRAAAARARQVHDRPVLGADADERRDLSTAASCARARSTRSATGSSRRAARIDAEITTRVEEVARARRRRRSWSPKAGTCSASIELKDIVKTHIKERFAELRRMGIQHRHDHRRQQAHRGVDRRRGRRRRLPRRGRRPRRSSS